MEHILVIGKESVGKSQLIASLTGANAVSGNFRGSTLAVESYRSGDLTYVDTPGLWRQSDAVTTKATLDALDAHQRVLVVAQATHLDADLAELLPLASEKDVAVAVTFWDKVEHNAGSHQALERLSQNLGVPLVPLDARHLDAAMRLELEEVFKRSRKPLRTLATQRVGWNIEPRSGPLEWKIFGPLLALGLLFLPAVLSVYAANLFAGWLDPVVQAALAPIIATLKTAPFALRELLVGRYGFVTMGPLLFVWAMPTVVLYALFLGLYKASGLAERAAVALHPLFRPVGLSGRDLLRVVMGWGCNVPAVIATRACSGCSRGACVSAIAFGAACSYQFGATLAVFAAAKKPELVWPYLAYLGATTLLYTRCTAPKAARSKSNLLLLEHRNFLSWPSVTALWREVKSVLRGFFVNALPIFFAVTLLASVLDMAGLLARISGVLAPLMAIFHLPPESALPVVLASIRKDGILLLSENATALSSAQLLTGVYLAGVLLPCLVTALTVSREMGLRFAARLVARQMAFAVAFSLALAWLIAPLLSRLFS